LKIGIVSVGIGNIGSLHNALYSQGWDIVKVSTASHFVNITHLIIPGVGSFATAMHRLEKTGLIEPIRKFAAQGLPLLGICLGMQILAEKGTEGGDISGLSLVPGCVIPLLPGGELRVPHVGWNEVIQMGKHPILVNVSNNVDFYFVHSYRFLVDESKHVLAETDYGERFPSIVSKANVVGVQFHPEKSQINGLRILDNFCRWDGKC
jgi:glutamine amidotransferase